MYAIQNRMKRTFIIPGIDAPDNSKTLHKLLTLEPGDTGLIEEGHWDYVKKGNQVIEALLTGRHLVVTNSANAMPEIHVDDLANPAIAEAPQELSEPVEGVTLETKTELKEITLDDGPKEGKGRKG